MNTVLDALNAALARSLKDEPTVVLMGEDILDPYGGAFKVTRGLSTSFPGRVLTTPISEAGMIGVATGMAVRGLRPVVEIMFGDFLTLAADQLINHAAKIHLMYAESVPVPLIVRSPMGGRRGYGPTHSQTLEKLFMGTPGLKVVAPCHLDVHGGPGGLLYDLITSTQQPVLFVENKLQYLLPLLSTKEQSEFEIRPGQDALQPAVLRIKDAPQPTITLAAYGYMAELTRQALEQLAYQQEIFAELVICTQLAPFLMDEVIASVKATGRLLTVEEGTISLGWGAEVLARVAEENGRICRSMHRLAASEIPVPASAALEEGCLPGVADIVRRVTEMVRGS
jgi:pyruvate/2-oxoglutarate/acetoin dehydrogenase E1 component